MKKQIRRGCFETNSSSTHAICISLEKEELKLPKYVDFEQDDFGWECKKYNHIQDKASYLYTAIESNKDILDVDECIEKIEQILNKYNIKCSFDDVIGGYIDHCSEDLVEWVGDICNNEEMLLNYLFSERSFVHTGNDNCGGCLDIKDGKFKNSKCYGWFDVDYKHKTYVKGN